MLLASSIPMKNEGVKGFPICVVKQKMFHTVLMIFFSLTMNSQLRYC